MNRHDGAMDIRAQQDGRDRLDEIVAGRIAAGVDQGPMFSTVGWRVRGKVFAFVGNAGDLIVKLPETRVGELVAAGSGEPMTLGRRTMREWVHIPPTGDWDALVVEAHGFVERGAS
jgi:hypothetical protein